MPSTSISGKAISNPFEPMPEPEPVFAEPWQAHAFALAVSLSESGLFTWSEWSAVLAAELAEADRRGEPDDGSGYYQHWLAALERLVAAKRLVSPPSLLARKEKWAEAFRRTPHGTPVTLDAVTAHGAATHPLPLPASGEREGPA
jgi:nitrile hydratase accessory protein